MLPDKVTPADGFSLSPGQTRYDASGKEIASLPKGATGVGSPSGLVDAVMNNPGLFGTLTPTIKAQLIPQLAAAGFDTTKLNVLGLPSGQQEDLTTLGSVQNFVNDLLAKGDDLKGVGGLGQGSFGQLLFGNLGVGGGGAEGQGNRDLIGQIQGAIAKLRGGTSFTPNEQRLLETYTPTINSSDAQIIQKLKDLNTFIENKRDNLVGLQAGTVPSGSASNTSASSQPPAFQLPNGTTVTLQPDGTYK